MNQDLLNNPRTALHLLQVGIAFAFLYAAVAAFMRPNDWVGYMPHFFENIVPITTQLKLFSLGEVILALWILSSWKLFYAALIATVGFAAITLVNLTIFDVTFRDVSLFFAALALALLAKNQK